MVKKGKKFDKIALNESTQKYSVIFFLFLHENICYGYSLEAPRRGASNVYPQHMFFYGEIRKILSGHPSYLSGAMNKYLEEVNISSTNRLLIDDQSVL